MSTSSRPSLPQFRFVLDELPSISTSTSISRSDSVVDAGPVWTCKSAVGNFCASALGAGIVAVPFCFKDDPIAAGATVLLLGLLSRTCIGWLAECGAVSNKSGFSDNVEFFMGKYGLIFFELNLLVLLFGTAVAMLDVVWGLVGQDWWVQRLVVSLLIILFVSFVGNKTDRLGFVSLVSTACIGVFVSTLVVEAMCHRKDLAVSSPAEALSRTSSTPLHSLSILTTLFVFNLFTFSIVQSLGVGETKKAASIAVSCCVVPLYLVTGFAGILAFSEIPSNVLLAEWSISPVAVNAAKLAIACTNVLRLPLVFGPMERSPWIKKLSCFNNYFFPAIACITVMTSFCISDIGSMLAFIGPTAAVTVGFTFPAALYFQLQKVEDEQADLARRIMSPYNQIEPVTPSARARAKTRRSNKVRAVAVLVLAVAATIAGLGSLVYHPLADRFSMYDTNYIQRIIYYG